MDAKYNGLIYISPVIVEILNFYIILFIQQDNNKCNYSIMVFKVWFFRFKIRQGYLGYMVLQYFSVIFHNKMISED